MTLVGGADETGRGPVIGPMVIALALCPKGAETELRQMGVKDSKLLTPEQRERLAPEIKKICEVSIVKITAREINKLMQQRVSLNAIEAMKIAEMLDEIGEEKLRSIETIHLDSPDPEAARFSRRIRQYVKTDADLLGKLHSSHKADVHFPIVSAASVVAKVVRDAEIEKIKHELGHDFGTGYPHDEATIAFLEEHINEPKVMKYVRTEWSTTKELLKRLGFKTKQVKLDL